MVHLGTADWAIALPICLETWRTKMHENLGNVGSQISKSVQLLGAPPHTL